MGLFLMCVSDYIHTPIYTIHKTLPHLETKRKRKREREKEEGEGGEGGEEEEKRSS